MIRRDERWPVAIAFAFLFGLVASHTALESARDGLFLARIPGTKLPFVYIAIAVLSYGAARLRNVAAFSSRRLEVAVYTAVAGVGTLALGVFLPAMADAGLYTLYVWSGVVTATILVQFWTVLGDVFTATQAKRLYGLIGLGGMIGAVAGSAAVSVFAHWVPPRTIVFAAGTGFLASAWLPRALPGRAETARLARTAPSGDPLFVRLRANVGYATRGPYVWRLVGIALAGSTTVTLTDYVFKSTMAATIPAHGLTAAFAQTYLVLNILALAAQVLAVGVLLRRFAPSTLVAILPVLLTIGGGALAATGGLFVAILAKGADGALRHGIYKTGLELLCIPLSDEGRRKVKTALEIVGQRGGQVLASSIILLMALLANGPRVSAFVVLVVAAVWAILSIRLHTYYVDQFRGSILDDRGRSVSVQLDVASLETLVATLDSESSAEVIAALSLLERERKDHLVPGLILYHPNEEVVIAALRLFARKRRRLAPHAFEYLASHASARIRAEAYAAKVALASDSVGLADALREEQAPEVRAAIITAMTATRALEPEEGRARLEELLRDASTTTKIVTAETIGWRRVEALDDIVIRLSSDHELPVRTAAVLALGALPTDRAADALVVLLADEPVQEIARSALAQGGRRSFDALVRALRDRSTAPVVRWALPRALVAANASDAADVLVANLEHESDGMVRYRTLVSLGVALDRDPRIALDKRRLKDEIRADVARAYRTMDRRLALEAGVVADPVRRTDGHALLVDLLRDKEKSAVGRIFRLLGLTFPEHDFGAIYRALENGERLYRAGAVELTSNLLASPLRDAVVGLVDEIDDEARMSYGAAYHDRIEPDYVAVVGRLVKSRSGVLRDAAAYHASELGSAALLAALREVAEAGKRSGDVERAIDVLTRTSGGPRKLVHPAAEHAHLMMEKIHVG
ncbi:MAG: hypothetical protein HOW73_12840 [Polyangiaceae bacterium]|nr:hypothetical protein [Polyangiaceae bacterium]